MVLSTCVDTFAQSKLAAAAPTDAIHAIKTSKAFIGFTLPLIERKG
jgi:hypothetical protein